MDIEMTKDDGLKVTNNASTAAERKRRYHERKRLGVLCMARVPIYPLDAEVLVKHGRLRPEDEKTRKSIAEAVEALVDDFSEGELDGAGEDGAAQQDEGVRRASAGY